MDIINFSKIAAPKFEFGCGFYFCVIGALKYIIGFEKNATAYQIKKGIVTSKNKMNVKLARSGGFALSLIEATPENMEGVKKWK